MTSSVVVVAPSDDGQGAALAAQLSLPIIESPALAAAPAIAYLQFVDGRLQLFPISVEQSGPVFVDLVEGATAHRLRGAGELIVKAVKGRSKGPLRVVDATAGLGRDSAVLANFGFDVILLERNRIVAALLADGLDRARHCDDARIALVAQSMQLHCVDAADYLRWLDRGPDKDELPDVVYLDPMFPASEKSALVKKEMRLFQQLFHQADADALDVEYNDLLQVARTCARLRVVVKRPRKAEPLAAQRPNYSLEGKAVRFDIYVSKRVENEA